MYEVVHFNPSNVALPMVLLQACIEVEGVCPGDKILSGQQQ